MGEEVEKLVERLRNPLNTHALREAAVEAAVALSQFAALKKERDHFAEWKATWEEKAAEFAARAQTAEAALEEIGNLGGNSWYGARARAALASSTPESSGQAEPPPVVVMSTGEIERLMRTADGLERSAKLDAELAEELAGDAQFALIHRTAAVDLKAEADALRKLLAGAVITAPAEARSPKPAPAFSGEEIRHLNAIVGNGSCHADRDGDCHHHDCPQLRDNEPAATGRHCPYDTEADHGE